MTINVLNGRTIINSAVKIGVAGLIIASSYGLLNFFQGCAADKGYARRADDIRKAIVLKDYKDASELLEGYKQKGLLRTEDAIKLPLEIKSAMKQDSLKNEKANILKGLEDKLFSGDYAGAQDKAMQLRNSGESNKNVDSIWNAIYSRTDDGFFRKTAYVSGDERQKALEKYLTYFPQGTHSKEVAKDYINYEFESITNAVNSDAEFSSVYTSMLNLTNDLKKFKGRGIDISNVVNIDAFTSSVNYYTNMHGIETGDKPKAGSVVKTHYVSYENISDLKTDFMKLRGKKFAYECRGKVLKDDGANNYYVQMLEGVSNSVSKEDEEEMKKYVDWGRKDVTMYNYNELTVLKMLDSVEKDRLTRTLSDIQTAYSNFTQAN